MWITMKTDYATRAILALALAGQDEPLRLADIAERTQVPPSFLEQIMGQLRGAGIVRSERGPAGGYRPQPGRAQARAAAPARGAPGSRAHV